MSQPAESMDRYVPPPRKVQLLELPWAPSVNDYWRHFWVPGKGRDWKGDGKRRGHVGRALSGKGTKYRDAVAAAVLMQTGRTQAGAMFVGPAHLTINAHPPDRKKRDLDNLLKSLLDALQYAKVLDDDYQVHELLIRRASVIPQGLLKVSIEALGHFNEGGK